MFQGWWAATVASYLLPKQAGGTPQIKVNPTEVRQEICHPVESEQLEHIVCSDYRLKIHHFGLEKPCTMQDINMFKHEGETEISKRL